MNRLIAIHDIVVTWPKTRSLESYVEVCKRALRDGKHILFRVPSLPSPTPERCYRVHDGAVRGYTPVLWCEERGEGEVEAVEGGFWPAGKYIVCRPSWYPLTKPIPMRGFQGWRWFDWDW